MGGKYSVMARALKCLYWEYSWYGDSFVIFVAKSIYALAKYEVVDIGKHGR